MSDTPFLERGREDAERLEETDLAPGAARAAHSKGRVHFEEPDPGDPVACSSIARSGSPRHVLSNTLGFGGSNCSVVMELAGDIGECE